MRDILFKNLTSLDKKRKIIASSEIVDQQGVRSIIRRHFVYIIRQVNAKCKDNPLPYVYVLKEHNTRKQTERFFCRIKGSVFAVCKGKLYLILFMHSLKIDLIAIPQDLMKYSQEDTT